MKRPIDELLFIYNADSGGLALLVDGVRKLLGVGECALCDLTHSVTGERGEWRTCRAELGVTSTMLHRDEMDEDLAQLVAGRLPCVVARCGAERVFLISPETIRRCAGNVSALRGKLNDSAALQDLELPAAADPVASAER